MIRLIENAACLFVPLVPRHGRQLFLCGYFFAEISPIPVFDAGHEIFIWLICV